MQLVRFLLIGMLGSWNLGNGTALWLSNFVINEVGGEDGTAAVVEELFLAALDRTAAVGLDGGLLVVSRQGAELRFVSAGVNSTE